MDNKQTRRDNNDNDIEIPLVELEFSYIFMNMNRADRAESILCEKFERVSKKQ